jgi:hypothetical protein
MKRLLPLIGLFFFAQTVRSQVSYTWNGSLSTAWNTAGNWTPGGIPGNIDNVTIVTGGNTCSLNANTSISNITLTSGTLDLGGFSLTAGGATAQFTKGTVQNGSLSIPAATTTNFTTGPVIMNCTVNIVTGTITIKNTTFQTTTTINKNGASNDNSSGNNIFNGVTTITNSGAGQLLLGNGGPDQFNAAVTFNNTGSNNIYVGYNAPGNVFGGVTTFNNAPSTNNGIYVSWLSTGTAFNNNIVVTSANGQGVQFCGGNGTATAVLSSGNTIAVGPAGFSAGNLSLRQFTQNGGVPQNLTLTGSGALYLGPSSAFVSALTASSPSLYLNGCTFISSSNLTKTGLTGDFSNGGNLFNGLCSITNSGSSFLVLGNNNPDTWNSDVTFTDNGSERLLPCWGSAGNQFNGNIIVNTSGSAQGIQFCGGNATATATQAATKTVLAGGTGLTAGYLYLKQFTQLGSAAISLTATGTSVLYLGPGSSFGGPVTVTAPDIWAQGATYSSAASFTKTGGSSNHNNQNQNIFNSTCTINQQSSGGYFMLGYNSNDLFNDNITVTSTGTGGIYLGWTSGTGTPTLAAGKTILVGGAGFSNGFLYLNTFTQLGNASMTLNFTGATTGLYFARSSVIGGNLTTSTPDIYLNGGTFNGTTSFTKTGASGDNGQGGNVFGGVSTMINTSSGFFMLGNNNPDTWNSDVTFTDNGSERILPCWGSAGNQFSGNIIVNTSGSAQGIQFCGGNAAATATQAAGETVQAGGTGLTAGYLYLKQFTQLGSTAITLTATGTSVLYLGPSSNFGGPVTVTAPDIWAQGATYNSAASFTKTGGTSNHNQQNQNIFNSTCTINQQSSGGYFMLGYNSNDLFNDNITVTSTGTGGIYLGWTSGTGTPTLAAGKTIQVGGAGFSNGFLYLNTFTQLGNAAMTLNFTGANTALYFARSSVIGGNLTSSTPDIFLHGCTFNGTTSITKTGAGSDNSQGGNIFGGASTITNSGAGFFLLGNNNPDTWNSDVTLTDNGSERLLLGWGSAGNQFSGNIILNTTGSAQGIQFCGGNATATATQAAGGSIQAGAGGLNAGYLVLRQFTQLGNAPVNLTLSNTATYLQYGPASVLGGNVTSSSPTLYLNGCTFNGTSNITKTGTTGDYSQGGNIFNGVCSITNSGSSYLLLGNTNPDIWNSDVTFTDNGSERLLPCWATVGNQFNGNIFVNTSGSAQGIQFCGGNNTATAIQAAGGAVQAGAGGLNAGYLILRQFTQLGNAATNLTLTSTATFLQFGPLSALGGNVVSSSPGLYFNGCTFSGTVSCTKTGASGDNSTGNNIFNGVTTITDNGAGQLLMGNGNLDQFNTTATFNNTGSNNFYIAYNSPNNIFGGAATFNNAPTANTGIYVSWNSAGTVFNSNITVTSTNGQGVQFCGGNGTATATLSAGNTISVGPAGFSTGTLLLRQFTQLGATAQNLPLTGTGVLTYGPASAFGGDLTSSSPTLFLNGCTFNGSSNITKTGTTGDNSQGGNIFNGISSITNSGSSFLLLGNNNPDTWNNDVTFTDNGSERLLPCWATIGNQFNGNIFVNTSGSAQGIQFCGGNNTATAIQSAGNGIQTGAVGLNAGYLIIRQFTQLGNAPINLNLSSTATYLQYGPLSALGGNVVSNSPGLYFNGCTFNGTVNSTKTGGSGDNSSGNNIFNGVTTITNNGAGQLQMGNGNLDQFNTTATFNNTGSNNFDIAWNSANNVFGGLTTFNNAPSTNNGIYVSWNSTGTVFSNNIVVTSTNGTGVQFCGGNASATATLSAGYTISVGAAGFSAGTLLLRQFTQTGGTPQTLTLTGTGNLTFGPLSAIGGNATTTSPTLLFNGCNFGGTVTSIKNGATNDASSGNNTFNGTFVVTNTGAGYVLMGNGNPDIWQSSATFNNLSTAQHMYTAYNSTGNIFNGPVIYNNQPGNTGLWIYANNSGVNTQFNGNITVTNVNGGGVYFGNGSGTAVLAGGGAISVGAAGFNTGGLIFKNFTQTGLGVAQNMTTTGTSYIQYGSSASFDGAVTSSSPGLFFNGTRFNGTVNGTKTGTTNDQSQGNNIFNGVSTFTNTGTGYLLMTVTTPDAYNSNVNFVQNNTGLIYPNYNGNSSYAGNVTITSPAATSISFGAGTGTATFSGTSLQTISVTASTPVPVFTRLTIAGTGGGVTLNTPINVANNLQLTSGLLNTTTTNILTMLNGSTTAVGTALSTTYVNGPMRYIKSTAGITTLNFPIGTSPDCRPVALTVNHSNGTQYIYQAQLFDASAAALGYTLPPSVDKVSGFHYYTIGRFNGALVNTPSTGLVGNQQIQIFFGGNDSVNNGATLTIVKNTSAAPTAWINIGGAGGPAFTGTGGLIGSISSTSIPSVFNSFSTFALADQIGGGNVLPVGLMNFHARPDHSVVDLGWSTSTESNNSYFTIERSRDGLGFDSLQRVNTEALNGNSSTELDYSSVDPNPYPGTSYYRLRQTDLDGKSSYSAIVSVNFDRTASPSVYPNPTSGALYIGGLDPGVTSMKAEWYDVSGKLLAGETVAVSGGVARLDARLTNGVYLLKFIASDGTFKLVNVMIMK